MAKGRIVQLIERIDGWGRTEDQIIHDELDAEWPHEPNGNGIPSEMWDFEVTRSQRCGAAAVMGVYGKEVQADGTLINRALASGLNDQEIADLEALRPLGEQERWLTRQIQLGLIEP